MRDDMTCATIGPCLVCERLGMTRTHCFSAGFERPERMSTCSEAIVDSFGFCAEHGALLRQQGEHTPAVRRILSRAAAQILDLLADIPRNADRIQEIFFAAEEECPGCHLHEHQVTHEIRALAMRRDRLTRTPRLCFSHYRDMVYALQSAELPALARRLLDVLRTAASTDAFEEADAGDASDAGSLADDAEECSVCTDIARAQTHWRDDVATAARLGRDVWIVFPTCSVHLRECASIGPRVAAMTARYAVGVELDVLARGIAWLERDLATREIARKSVFYRRQSPAYILGQQRKMITRLPRCPACERLVVARDRSIADLVQRLRRGGRERDFRQVRHLCLKHFAAVYLLLPPDDLRLTVAALQMDELRAIADGWQDARGSEASTGDANLHWRAAVQQFATRINR